MSVTVNPPQELDEQQETAYRDDGKEWSSRKLQHCRGKEALLEKIPCYLSSIKHKNEADDHAQTGGNNIKKSLCSWRQPTKQ